MVNVLDYKKEYKKAVELLYNIQYTIKMSKKGNDIFDGYFDYVVPPLEGFWWFDINDKRQHHEIYLSDPRKTDKEKMKTILRIPVKKK